MAADGSSHNNPTYAAPVLLYILSLSFSRSRYHLSTFIGRGCFRMLWQGDVRFIVKQIQQKCADKNICTYKSPAAIGYGWWRVRYFRGGAPMKLNQ